MKRLIYIILSLTLTLNLNAQTIANGSQASNSNITVSGVLTYSSVYGLGANGYVAPITGNINLPAPKLISTEDGLTFTVYPNPAHSIVTVRLSSKQTIDKFTLSLYDLNGKKLSVRTRKNIAANTAYARVSLEGLATGNYFLKITVNNTEANFKIIKK